MSVVEPERPARRYGPVELYAVRFTGHEPDVGVLKALTDQVKDGTVRLLDLIVGGRRDDGSLVVLEAERMPEEVVDDLDLEAEGLIADEDIAACFAAVRPGEGVAIIVFELAWAATLAQRLESAGGVVDRWVRVSAPHVNEVVAAGLVAAKEGED